MFNRLEDYYGGPVTNPLYMPAAERHDLDTHDDLRPFGPDPEELMDDTDVVWAVWTGRDTTRARLSNPTLYDSTIMALGHIAELHQAHAPATTGPNQSEQADLQAA